MKRKQLIWMRRGMLCFTLLCTAMAVYRFAEHRAGETAYDSAAALAIRQEEDRWETTAPTQATQATQPPRQVWVPVPVKEEDPVITELQDIDLEDLRQKNPDVIGWIRIPNTKINYPILQGEDNDYYLNHTWEKNNNTVGSIFMEWQNKPDFTQFNTILYGHNMQNGTMFGHLHNIQYRDFQDQIHYVYVVNDKGILRYEIFSMFQVNIGDFVYGLSFNQSQTRIDFLAEALSASVVDTGVEPGIHDRILTLSTCSARGREKRWVVMARLPMVLTQR